MGWAWGPAGRAVGPLVYLSRVVSAGYLVVLVPEQNRRNVRALCIHPSRLCCNLFRSGGPVVPAVPSFYSAGVGEALHERGVYHQASFTAVYSFKQYAFGGFAGGFSLLAGCLLSDGRRTAVVWGASFSTCARVDQDRRRTLHDRFAVLVQTFWVGILRRRRLVCLLPCPFRVLAIERRHLKLVNFFLFCFRASSETDGWRWGETENEGRWLTGKG